MNSAAHMCSLGVFVVVSGVRSSLSVINISERTDRVIGKGC